MHLVYTGTYWKDRGGLKEGKLAQGIAAIARGIAMPSLCTEYVLVRTMFIPVYSWYMLNNSIVCTNAALCYT